MFDALKSRGGGMSGEWSPLKSLVASATELIAKPQLLVSENNPELDIHSPGLSRRNKSHAVVKIVDYKFHRHLYLPNLVTLLFFL